MSLRHAVDRETPSSEACERVEQPAGAGGVPDAVAASIMGHADTKILRRYQEIVGELKQSAAIQMDSLLGGRGQGHA